MLFKAVLRVALVQLPHMRIAVRFCQNAGRSNSSKTGIAFYKTLVRNAGIRAKTIAIDEEQLRWEIQRFNSAVHSGERGLQNIYLVYLAGTGNAHSPGQRFGFNNGPQQLALRRRKRFAIGEQRMVEARRQNNGRSIYRSGKAAPAGLVHAGFRNGSLKISSNHKAERSGKIKSCALRRQQPIFALAALMNFSFSKSAFFVALTTGVLLAGGLLLLAGCGKDRSAGKQKSVFRINLSSGSLESLDPAYAKDLYTIWTAHAIYNTLTEVDSAGNLQPSLAKSWTVSEDGKHWRFALRPNVRFQDNAAFAGGKGRRLTAADVVYSFRRILDPAVASSGAWIFNGRVDSLKPFEAPDDTTFILHLREPFSPLPALLSMAYCGIVPQEVTRKWGAEFRRHPCGSGPFQMAGWEEGAALILHRNPHYWEQDAAGKALPYLDAVQYSFYDSKATEFLLFLQGKLHFVNNIDGSFKDLVLRKDGQVKPEFKDKFQLLQGGYLNTEYLGILVDTGNALLRGSALRSRQVRQAIGWAIDRERIRRYFRNGLVVAANGGFIPPGLPGYAGGKGFSYRPDKALELLAAAGFPKGKGLPAVVIQTPDNYLDIVQFVCGQLAEVGILAKPEVLQPNILRQQMSASKSAFFRAQWIADYPDAETYLAPFYSRLPAPPNYTRFQNAQFDGCYEEAVRLPDTPRWERYRQMDSLVLSEAPVIPLFYDRRNHFVSPAVQGFQSDPMNTIELKRVRFEK